MSQVYLDDSTAQKFDVKAFAVDANDPGLQTNVPWGIWKTTAGPWEFLVRTNHPVFSSVTMTPLDALLAQLAWQAADFTREQGLAAGFPQILSGLRAKYAKRYAIDPTTLAREAERQLQDAAKSVVGRVDPASAQAFFDQLGMKDQIFILMAKRGVNSPQNAVEDGRFLQYCPPAVIRDFIIANLGLFLDGHYWADSFSTLNLGSPVATAAAISEIQLLYSSLLADAVWLVEQGQDELADAIRERLLRAAASIEILGMSISQGAVL